MGLRRNIGISIGLVALTLFVGSPHAAEITIEAEATSTFFSAPFNFEGAGTANYAVYSGRSNLGRFTGQGVSQSAPTTDPPTACTLSDGTAGIRLALTNHVAVSRFELQGDLLIERGGPGALTACLDLASLRFEETGTVQIVGGTGRFEGATGTEDVTVSGQILVSEPPAPGSTTGLAFGYSTGTFTFNITVPDAPPAVAP
jgi:hypothetical protein